MGIGTRRHLLPVMFDRWISHFDVGSLESWNGTKRHVSEQRAVPGFGFSSGTRARAPSHTTLASASTQPLPRPSTTAPHHRTKMPGPGERHEHPGKGPGHEGGPPGHGGHGHVSYFTHHPVVSRGVSFWFCLTSVMRCCFNPLSRHHARNL